MVNNKLSVEVFNVLDNEYHLNLVSNDKLIKSTEFDINNLGSVTEIQFGFSKIDSDGMIEYIGKSVKLPKKKEIDLNWFMNKINENKIYENFASQFNSIIKNKLSGASCYPTTYGVGIFVAIGFKDKIDQTKKIIETELNNLGVKYSTSYSDAMWVFRYNISKSKETMNIIQNMN